MSTETSSTRTGGMSFWKILAIIVLALIAISLLGTIVKAVLWLALAALVVIGAFVVVKAFASSK
ncbi:MAG: hypothetical protein QM658_12885 [Gordonia sp. (in: high G+C Gram-positive bacteria)]